MPDNPHQWSIEALTAAYVRGDASPVEVTESSLEAIADRNGRVGAFVHVMAEQARAQAEEATQAYRRGEGAPLLGVPLSIKDAFHLRGEPTGLGSLVHDGQTARSDSGVARRLRAAGAIFVGKTNTAEFGQSATCENRLDIDTKNPWRVTHTPGGSSGGAAASVAADMVPVAIGSDGGGSIRIPAAFTGVFGFKPTLGICPDENGFRGMTRFVTPGPLTRRVADARAVLSVLSERPMVRRASAPALRVGLCVAPEGRPVAPALVAAIEKVAILLTEMGHHVEPTDPRIEGWKDIFGPLVLDDENRERGHLLRWLEDKLTDYEVATLRAAQRVNVEAVSNAEHRLPEFRQRVDDVFADVDVLLTPVVATTAFEIGHRPTLIDGRAVDRLWGAFPFAAPFNVAGTPAASIPCGLEDGLPMAVQIVARRGRDEFLLDLAEDLEESIGFGDITSGSALPAFRSEQR